MTEEELNQVIIQGVKDNTIKAIIIFKHCEHCTDEELKNALTLEQLLSIMK